MQIYENESKGRYFMLVGMTKKMWKAGKTPEEIALAVKYPVEKVLECIDMCKKVDEKRGRYEWKLNE